MNNDYLMHYGVKGMRWGVRKARRDNAKIDKSFKAWGENSQKRDNAISLGKQANIARMEWERNSNDKNAKAAYKKANREYKRALRSNTTYRKGQIQGEVRKDLSRKYLSESKKIKKQLDADPNNRELQKAYKYLSDQHQYERAKGRRAPTVGQKRSAKKASMKRRMTAIGTAALVETGMIAVSYYLMSRNLNVSTSDVNEVRKAVKLGKEFLSYIY